MRALIDPHGDAEMAASTLDECPIAENFIAFF
jgi:hypothetical protein